MMDKRFNHAFGLAYVISQLVPHLRYIRIIPFECPKSYAIAVDSNEHLHHPAILLELVVDAFAEASDTAEKVHARNYVRRYLWDC